MLAINMLSYSLVSLLGNQQHPYCLMEATNQQTQPPPLVGGVFMLLLAIFIFCWLYNLEVFGSLGVHFLCSLIFFFFLLSFDLVWWL